jgi:hypothetical protein
MISSNRVANNIDGSFFSKKFICDMYANLATCFSGWSSIWLHQKIADLKKTVINELTFRYITGRFSSKISQRHFPWENIASFVCVCVCVNCIWTFTSLWVQKQKVRV